ncbi:MAG: SUMF1/EgtB/PvdO family nonheme iron enzyme [Planctomycetes bacterium]|nr:SUMF1/EgtB/PvdO family nonheme iron enzyme [Planctomycetota bacterium]
MLTADIDDCGLSMGSETTYDVFLSYNSQDREVVLRISKELKKRECSSFLDQWYLKPGHDWVEALERALAASRSVAVFLGPHEMGRWQQRERAWALDRLAANEDFPVVPVLLPGSEPPLGFLKQLMWIDLRDDPTSATQLDAMAAAIRDEQVDLDGKPQPRAMICPYRGLLAFREEDADFFFGRDEYLEQLVSLVKRETLVAVVGASGSGKSSLVSAGLIPQLRKYGDGPVWDVVRMVPNVDPLYSLAEALVPLIEPDLSRLALERELNAVANDLEQEKPETPLWGLVNAVLRQQPGTERLLLLVDQWEELYTNCEKPARRERFIAELLEATSRQDSPLTVILTVRSDFYGEILQDRPLLDRLQVGLLNLGPMNTEELRSVIEGPAKNVGLTFQDGLVDRILKEAGEEPGRLPLLEFALEELWKRRDGDQLTHAGYKELGRQPDPKTSKEKAVKSDCLSGAIAKYAEGVYGELSVDERAALPGLFRKLVRAGAKTEDDTRRRAALSELDVTTRRVARKLADKRLLITTETGAWERATEKNDRDVEADSTSTAQPNESGESSATVEMVHEELLRRWGRLKEWVNEDRQFLLWRSRLDLKVEEYQRDGDAALFKGRPLHESRKFYLARSAELEESERRFLDTSLKASRRRKLAGLLVLTVAIVAGLLINNNIVQTSNRDRADSFVRNLKKADIENVPEIVREIAAFREVVGEYLDEQLREAHQQAGEHSPEKLRTAMALLSVDGNQVGFLRDRLLDCSMDEFGVIRDSLQSHQDGVTEWLWSAFRNNRDEKKRFRAGLALAKYVPNGDQWTDEDATFLVDTLLGHAAEEQPQIRNYLKEIKTRLYVELQRAFRDPSARERKEIGSAKAFAQFAVDDIGRIADLAAEATVGQYKVLYPLLEASSDPAVHETLRPVAAQQPGDELSQPDRVALGRRRAGAAITLLRKGDRQQIFDVFRVTDDPESLTQFVHHCRERGITVDQLLDCLDQAEAMRQTKTGDQRKLEDRVLFGLLLALGEFAATDVPSPQREELVSRLVDWYASDPSSTIHGASGWLLRHWGYQSEAEQIDQTDVPYVKDREWFIKKIDAEIPGSRDGESQTKSFYFTFIVFEDGEYAIGSPDNEADRQTDESKQTAHLTRRFAVLDREITREEYEAFGGKKLSIDEWSPPPGKHPVVASSWYDSVAFCRALTTQTGLSEDDQCYADPEILDPKDFPREPDPKFNQYPRNWKVRLDRSGFRLPTEAEWEVMCRAETASMYHFGSDRTLLNRYGWFADNSGKQTQLPRSLRPNLRGLFDTYGNVYEWCHDWYSSRRDANAENPFGPSAAGSSRVLRGGGWSDIASNCRSAYRGSSQPTSRGTRFGFRVVSVLLFPSRP